ncbi:GNAT family N-acetyltransferase [Sphaerisporangium flaviroseum]|uniref:GNAT family N-acetyltransferase n=1 Tax=Sphaerisporangium flaviroseum TaxID=509199 RepID=A0ABP7J8R0_9ACTN
MDHAIKVADNPGAARYEITVDGRLAGFAAYRALPGRLVFTHTEVDQEFEGHGFGSTLVRGALDSAREAGVTVVPRCPFVASYIKRHPEYGDLLAAHDPETEHAGSPDAT